MLVDCTSDASLVNESVQTEMLSSVLMVPSEAGRPLSEMLFGSGGKRAAEQWCTQFLSSSSNWPISGSPRSPWLFPGAANIVAGHVVGIVSIRRSNAKTGGA